MVPKINIDIVVARIVSMIFTLEVFAQTVARADTKDESN